MMICSCIASTVQHSQAHFWDSTDIQPPNGVKYPTRLPALKNPLSTGEGVGGEVETDSSTLYLLLL
ncbi:MAG: hypothetical protein ACK4GN_13130 [Runella sp.]